MENERLRHAVKFDSLSFKSFMKYLHLLNYASVRKIAAELPNKFGIIFDDWSDGHTNRMKVGGTIEIPLLAIQLSRI